MHRVIILACCAVSLSVSLASVTNTSQKLNITLNKNKTLQKTRLETFFHNSLKNINDFKQNETINTTIHYAKVDKTEKAFVQLQHNHYSTNEGQNTLSMLNRIHARITRSKDAVWAAITLTFMCILLVLAVAQSRMWKDRYQSESQGVPLPNFNERVLFKDVMEHKIATLKTFFKKKSKEKNVTELESLLPPSEWDD